MKQFQGTAASGGICIAPCFRQQQAPAPARQQLSPGEELSHFEGARKAALAELLALREEGTTREAREIFATHAMMLTDEDFLDTVRRIITLQQHSAASAVKAAVGEFSSMFEEMDSAYMRERAADVREIGTRLLRLLSGQVAAQPDTRCILCAAELSAADTASFDPAIVCGFATEDGTAASHAAILARAKGIPAVVGLGEALRTVDAGTLLILDGSSGIVIADPDTATLCRYEAALKKQTQRNEQLHRLAAEESRTADGHKVIIAANIGTPDEVESALKNGAEGVGLMRSEFLFLSSPTPPTEEMQFEAYKSVLTEMHGQRVVIRTLDIGADKQAPCLPLPAEPNPALGCRAIRVSLARRDLFAAQIRALLRAAKFGHLAVMFPLIISLAEVREIKRFVALQKTALTAGGYEVGSFEFGIMIETPAAALISDSLAQEVDFFSIGTNDLAQYTLAADRTNPAVAALCDPHHPAVLGLISVAAESARRYGKPVAVCGEAAADPALAEAFLRMGITELSVSPAAVLPLREAVRSFHLD